MNLLPGSGTVLNMSRKASPHGKRRALWPKKSRSLEEKRYELAKLRPTKRSLGSAFSHEAALYGNASRESAQNGRPDKDMNGGHNSTRYGFFANFLASPAILCANQSRLRERSASAQPSTSNAAALLALGRFLLGLLSPVFGKQLGKRAKPKRAASSWRDGEITHIKSDTCVGFDFRAGRENSQLALSRQDS
jgi:hypothetical protein